MKKNRKGSRFLALILCMSLILGTNSLTLAAEPTGDGSELGAREEGQEPALLLEETTEEVSEGEPAEEETPREEETEPYFSEEETGSSETSQVQNFSQENQISAIKGEDTEENQFQKGQTTENPSQENQGRENETQGSPAGENQQTEGTEMETSQGQSQKAKDFADLVNRLAQLLYGEGASFENIEADQTRENYKALTEEGRQEADCLTDEGTRLYEEMDQQERDSVVREKEKLDLVGTAREEWKKSQEIYGLGDAYELTKEEYQEMLSNLKEELESRENGNIPIEEWRRSSALREGLFQGTQSDWSQAAGLELDLTDENLVWNGSRIQEDGSISHPVTEGGLGERQITAWDGRLYDFASWERGGASWEMGRFQGVFDLSGVDRERYSFTLEPAVGGKEILLGGPLFVFVYPEGTSLNDENYLDYLAFWSQEAQEGEYRGISEAAASASVENPLSSLVSGWSTQAVRDNVGDIIQRNPKAARFAVDVFSGAGGMYRLKLTAKETGKTEIQLKKVDSENEKTGLPGAKFQLVKEGGGARYLGVSQENGTVNFSVPVPASQTETYTLTELQAPEDYQLGETISWTVRVHRNGEYEIEKLDQKKGIYLVPNKKKTDKPAALNQLKLQEPNSASVDLDKTAEPTEKEREYKITLNASSKATTGGKPGSNASIVLLLDNSSSLTLSDRNSMHIAAKAFVEKVFDNSPESKMAVVNFKTDISVNSSGLEKVSAEGMLTELNQHIDNVDELEGDTATGDALERAQELLERETENAKYIVLFTDGNPETLRDAIVGDALQATKAYSIAESMRSGDVVVYGIGFGKMFFGGSAVSDGTFEWDSENNPNLPHSKRISCSDYLRLLTSGDRYFHTLKSIDRLNAIFEQIAGEIAKPASTQAEKIQDVIDPRFTLTEQSKKDLKDAGATVQEQEDGSTVIIWNNQEIQPASGENGKTPGWKQSFTICAKEDFIGGNRIPTNGEDSGILVEGDSQKLAFPKPTVNVPIGKISLENKEKTVFLGEERDSSGFGGEILDTLKVNEESIGENLDIADETINNTAATSYKYEYSYPGTTDPVGKFVFKYTPDLAGTTLHEVKGEETYALEVRYEPYTQNEREAKLPGYKALVGKEVTGEKEPVTGTYKIETVSGSIAISKSIDNYSEEEAPVFTFKIEKKKGDTVEKTYYRTIRMTKVNDNAELLEGLPRGEYRITELAVQKYGVESVQDNGSSCKTENGKDSITVFLGVDKKEKDSIDAKEAKVLFKNQKTGGNSSADSDVRLNRFTYENGTWVIRSYTVPQKPENPTNTSESGKKN